MDAVCFDVDGVVVASGRYWRDREREELLPWAVGEPVPLSEVTGLNVDDRYDHLPDSSDTRVTESAFLDAYDEAAAAVYGSEARLLPGFETLVADPRAAGVATVLVSSSPVGWFDLVLDRFDLRDAFDAGTVADADHVAADAEALASALLSPCDARIRGVRCPRP